MSSSIKLSRASHEKSGGNNRGARLIAGIYIFIASFLGLTIDKLGAKAFLLHLGIFALRRVDCGDARLRLIGQLLRTMSNISGYATNQELRIPCLTFHDRIGFAHEYQSYFRSHLSPFVYRCSAELSPSGDPPPIYFPSLTRIGGKDGLLLRFTTSNGKQWDGCFAFGDYGLRGVFACPDPNCACVVSDGTGYWVSVNEPENSFELGVLPIRDIRSVADPPILLVADFTSLYAFGPDGQLWKRRLCWDDLNISRIQQGIGSGTGYDPTNSEQRTSGFAVELATGRVLRSAWLSLD